ncbi:hypothetical protein TIFTF001_038209 [Ficus carica]|uniref:Uncharacterized protein n=1 Tax=Ficus carica TaxID=3494 RepID=A0AA88E6X5_FICCA|nr:hypothetical protein TIFTF001_038209 [Ficus carica]
MYIHIQPSDTVSAHSFGNRRRSWTSFGNPYRPLMDDKSSSVKTERGFNVCRNYSTLSLCGGLVNRAIRGVNTIPSPETIAGRFLSDASLLVRHPSAFERTRILFSSDEGPMPNLHHHNYSNLSRCSSSL